MKRVCTLALGVSLLFLGLGIYNFVLNLLSVPPIRLSLPYLVIGILIVAFLVVKKSWLRK